MDVCDYRIQSMNMSRLEIHSSQSVNDVGKLTVEVRFVSIEHIFYSQYRVSTGRQVPCCKSSTYLPRTFGGARVGLSD